MSDEIDFNSQVISEKTLVSTEDDPGKYEVQLAEEGQTVEPKDIPSDKIEPLPAFVPRKKTNLRGRYFVLMQAWGPTQIAWDDPQRTALTITNGTQGMNIADNPNVLNTTGISSGVGLAHIFANQVVRLDGYTGPLYAYPDADNAGVSVAAITEER